MLKQLVCVSLFTAATAGMAGCDESLKSVAGPTPNLEPSFTSIQREVFEAGDSSGRTPCVTCHTSTGRAPSGGLNLNHDAAYDQLAGVAARAKPGAVRVIPGDADNSYLVQKLLGMPGIVGRRMPFNGPPFLTDGQITIVQRWIAIGAPRN